MINTYFISDTHFGHTNILLFEKHCRPYASIEEHDRDLIARWNSAVRPCDKVYHLGDFCMSKKAIAVAKELNGHKRLVMGNHDIHGVELYGLYFEKIYGAFGYKECSLTHIPIHPQQLTRYKYNLHGHLHSKTVEDKRYFNCSVEKIGMTPILFARIMETLEGKV